VSRIENSCFILAIGIAACFVVEFLQLVRESDAHNFKGLSRRLALIKEQTIALQIFHQSKRKLPVSLT
jgi:hypothetical protein